MVESTANKNHYPTPIFLFSIPRSGSTLLQRILASNREIATATEPWVALGPLYTLKEKGIISDYNHRALNTAINDFCTVLPNGRDDYLAEIREFILRLYARASRNGAAYFLDKTPRYLLVIEEIIHLFPEAKFIFLWRSPLAVIASIIRTFEEGRWELGSFRVDLFESLPGMIESWGRHREKGFSLRYEDLIGSPENVLPPLFSYLGLPYDARVLSEFDDIHLSGNFGDKTGSAVYRMISTEPVDKWKTGLSGPIRKAWCRRYLKRIGRGRLEDMGYDLDQLLRELDAIPVKFDTLFSDLKHVLKPILYPGFTVDQQR